MRLSAPTILAKNAIRILQVSLKNVINGKNLFQRDMKQSGIKLRKHNVMPERMCDELKMLPLTEEGMEKISSNNFYDVVEYIKQHDAGMMKKMNHVRNMGNVWYTMYNIWNKSSRLR